MESSAEPSRLFRTPFHHSLIARTFRYTSCIFAIVSSINLSAQESVETTDALKFAPVAKASQTGRQANRHFFTVRYRPVDLEMVERSWPHQKLELEQLAESLNTIGVSRVILPDPDAAEQLSEKVIRFAELLVRHKIDIWFELAPRYMKSEDTVFHDMLNFHSGPLDTTHTRHLQSIYLKRCKELAALRNDQGQALAAGFFFPLRAGESLPAGLDAELSKPIFDSFLKDMDLAKDWAKSLDTQAKQLQFIKTTGLMPWVTWRSRRVAEFYSVFADQVFLDTTLQVNFAVPSTSDPKTSTVFQEARTAGLSPLMAWQWMAFDPLKWPQSPSYSLMQAESLQNQADDRENVNHPDLINAMKNRTLDGHWFAIQSGSAKPMFPWTRFQDDQLVPLQAALSAFLSRQDSDSLIVDYPALIGSEDNLQKWIRKHNQIQGLGITLRQKSESFQGVAARFYPESESSPLVLINSLPCRMVVTLTTDQPVSGMTMESLDEELQPFDLSNLGGDSKHTWSIPPYSWGRIRVSNAGLTNLIYEASVPDDAMDIVQTRYEELLDHRSGPSPITLSSLPVPVEREAKSKGRRLMAALQAYRESRLADFFRLSDGIVKERRNQRSMMRNARIKGEESQNNRILR